MTTQAISPSVTTQAISPSVTTQVISPLRQRMIEDMSIRKFTAKTQHDYVQRVKDFATFLGRSPGTANSEEVRRFRLHLASCGAGTPTINATCAALRFFFKVTLDRPDLAKHLTFVHEPRKIPVVLSPEEVARFLEAALRVSEVVSLKVSDIDSQRMMLRVEQGKGRKDRHAMLSPVLLQLLRDWYRLARFTAGEPERWSTESATPAGRLRHLKPAVQLSETPPYWARPSVPLALFAPKNSLFGEKNSLFRFIGNFDYPYEVRHAHDYFADIPELTPAPELPNPPPQDRVAAARLTIPKYALNS